MRILALIILFLITIGGWGFGVLAGLLGKSAIHEILSAVYFLIGTVAFAAAMIVGQLWKIHKDAQTSQHIQL